MKPKFECPFCGESVEPLWHNTTLVGWWPPDPDPNHHTAGFKHCGREFNAEWRETDKTGVAYTQPREDGKRTVLIGVPPKCCRNLYAEPEGK